MTDTRNIASKAAGFYAESAGLLCCNRVFAVLDSTAQDLGMYLVEASGSVYSQILDKAAPLLGVGPLTRAIAEKIVKTANLSHIIPDGMPDMLGAEIKRHYALSAKVIAFMEKNPEKESLKLNTSFECAPGQKLPVAISIPEVKDAAARYARQYAQIFSEFLASGNTRVIDLEKIILLGDTLAEGGIFQDFEQMAEGGVVHYPSSQVSDIMAFVPSEPDDEKTMIQPIAQQPKPGPQPGSQMPPSLQAMLEADPPAPAPKPAPAFISQYSQVPSLSIQALESGTWVRLDTFDPTPGKGAAFQEMEYLGDGLFRVISSGRSLAPGDIAKPFAAIWQTGVQVDMEITRGTSSLGRFRTRVVKSISIKNCRSGQ